MKTRRDGPDLYEAAFYKFCDRTLEIGKLHGSDASKKYLKDHFLFYAIKYLGKLSLKNRTESELKSLFELCQIVRAHIGVMTPREFATFFPIDKTYDGAKWGNKDYFHTMKYINGIGGMDTVIGKRDLEFIYEYDNWDVRFFTLTSLAIISEIQEELGGKSLIEELADDLNLEIFTEHDFGTGVVHLIGDKGTTHILKDGVGFQTNIGGIDDGE
ncbi:hypothetical protein [Listeria booriae]|uniref:hypothetical protein n=1 Tax=Listeria booriae TaxID=1552123 RepID=UPI0016263561|nr:hypothetical protein [Listeria booriae]MBC1524465.1 hypothetical protein [Listeria booriae]MBC6306443.1 hypothetical protein [Listeria booriae]